MASPIALDATTRMPMPKKPADGENGGFRSILEETAPQLRRLERLASEEDVGQAPLAPLDATTHEAAAKADERETDDSSADDEPAAPTTTDGDGDMAAAGLPPASQAIEELRQLLGGTAQQPAGDGGAAPGKANGAEAKAEAAAMADDGTARHAADVVATTAAAEAAKSIVAHAAGAAAAPKPGAAKAAAGQPVEMRPGAVDAQAAATDGAEMPAERIVPRGSARDDGGDPRQDANRQGPGQGAARAAPGVTVVADAGVAAPTAPQAATRTVVATLGADPSWAAYFRARPEPVAQSAPQSLTIQLRPAELGVVTAHLRFAGERVAVELQAETPEARRQLASDSDLIARSLRAAGLEVDQVTVQPASQAQDAGRGQTFSGRDGAGSGPAFASQEGAGGRDGRQAGSHGSQGFTARGGDDEIRSGTGGADRDGRYI